MLNAKSREPANGEKEADWPRIITVRGIPGISAKIYKTARSKTDKEGKARDYTAYVLAYSLLGKRKLEAFSDLEEAEAAAQAAIKKIANGEQQVLELKNEDRLIYLRAKELVAPLGVPIDQACEVYAQVMKALGGKGDPLDACREYVKRHSSISAKILVPDAVKELLASEEKQKEGRRKSAWVKLLRTHLQNKFAPDFNTHVHLLDPPLLNKWFAGLACSERTKKNIRDVVKHFFKWCRGQGYLSKDADPLANVQDFRKRKRGKIHILTPDELTKLLACAGEDMAPYLALRAFAGLRDAEASAIDWAHIDLEEGWVTITEEVAKQSDDEEGLRRLIPVRDCLKRWLKKHVKTSGRVYPYATSSKQIAELCQAAGVKWKRNCLRHSFISYAVAESGDFAAVAIQSGNSVAVIKQHYYQVVKPAQAKAWFGILPPGKAASAPPSGKAQQPSN